MQGAIGPAPRRTLLRERGFKLLLWLCLAASVVMLVTLLVDVTSDGFSRLSPSFITEYASSVADRAGVRAALL